MQLLQGGTQLYSNALPRLQMPSTDSNVRKQKQDTGVTSGRRHPRDPRVDEGRGHVHQAVTGSGHRTEATPLRVTH